MFVYFNVIWQRDRLDGKSDSWATKASNRLQRKSWWKNLHQTEVYETTERLKIINDQYYSSKCTKPIRIAALTLLKLITEE